MMLIVLKILLLPVLMLLDAWHPRVSADSKDQLL
jgi:hypothetical protein